jgi:hypothetical protein
MFLIALTGAMLALGAGGVRAEAAKPHRIAIQVDQNDAAVMNLALNNASNMLEHYRAKGEEVEVEIVA